MKNHCGRSPRTCYVSRLALAGMGLLFLGALQAESYDFEHLQDFQVLNGQDAWVSQPSLGEITIRPDDSAANGSQIAQPLLSLASGWTAFLTRVNDEAFAFSPYFGDEALAVSRFDTTAAAVTGLALGRDLDGDGMLLREAGEVGPSFGTFRDPVRGSEHFAVVSADNSVLYLAPLNAGERCCNEPDDWYRLQFQVDISTTRGVGALSYKNLTRGDETFQPIAELQGLDLHMDVMHPDANPQTWNAMLLTMRFDGKQHLPKVDNLQPRVAAVLEYGMGLSLQAVDSQTVFSNKFDVYLEPVTRADDPNGYYWRLARYRAADSGVVSVVQMNEDFDLLLDTLDVSLAFPSLGDMERVRLEFVGWQAGIPETMLWRYVGE